MPEFTPLSEKIAKYQEKERRELSRLGALVAGIVVVAILGFTGWRLYQDRGLPFGRQAASVPQEQQEKISTESSVPSQPPAPATEISDKELFDRGALSLQILNGSGVSGKAAELLEPLQGLGYSQAQTGDAAYSTYTLLNLAVKAGGEELRTFIKEDLGKVYPEVQVDSLDDLSEDSEFDAVIIVGTF